MLSGRYPATTGIFEIGRPLRATMPDITTLPQHFKDNGYHTRSLGKVYHVGIDDETMESAVLDACRCDALLPSMSANDQRAPPKDTATDSVASQPAVRREMRVPPRMIRTTPASGASRQIQAPVVTLAGA